MRRLLPAAVIAVIAVLAAAMLFAAPDTTPTSAPPDAVAAQPPSARPARRAPPPSPTPAPPAAPPADELSPGRRALTPTIEQRPAADGEAPPPEEVEVPDGVTVWPTTKAGIDGAVREVIHDIRRCYQEALAEVPDLDGGLTVGFTIGEHDGVGGVRSVAIDAGDLEDGPMEDCVMDVLSVLQFDPPADGGEIAVSYPFKFSPG